MEMEVVVYEIRKKLKKQRSLMLQLYSTLSAFPSKTKRASMLDSLSVIIITTKSHSKMQTQERYSESNTIKTIEIASLTKAT